MGNRECFERDTAYDNRSARCNHSAVTNWVAFQARPRIRCRVDRTIGSALETSNVVRMRMGEHDGFRRSEAAEPIRPAIYQNPFLDHQATVPAVDSAPDLDLAACARKQKPHGVSSIRESPPNRVGSQVFKRLVRPEEWIRRAQKHRSFLCDCVRMHV